MVIMWYNVAWTALAMKIIGLFLMLLQDFVLRLQLNAMAVLYYKNALHMPLGDISINEIARNGLLLSQDPYGNYVIQYVMDLKIPSAMAKLINQLKGHFVRLSTQKCSSHVVEKCLKYFEESRPKIIHELLSVPCFEQLLQDPYANYALQSALTVTKGPLRASLVEAAKPHIILRTSSYCKRIFSRELLKK